LKGLRQHTSEPTTINRSNAFPAPSNSAFLVLELRIHRRDCKAETRAIRSVVLFEYMMIYSFVRVDGNGFAKMFANLLVVRFGVLILSCFVVVL